MGALSACIGRGDHVRTGDSSLATAIQSLCCGLRSSSLAPAVSLSSETPTSSTAVAVQQQLEFSGWAGSVGAFPIYKGRADQIRPYRISPLIG